jgi:hypothetical protein
MLPLDGSKRMKYVINYIIAISMAQMVKTTIISSWCHGILRKVTTAQQLVQLVLKIKAFSYCK